MISFPSQTSWSYIMVMAASSRIPHRGKTPISNILHWFFFLIKQKRRAFYKEKISFPFYSEVCHTYSKYKLISIPVIKYLGLHLKFFFVVLVIHIQAVSRPLKQNELIFEPISLFCEKSEKVQTAHVMRFLSLIKAF